MIKVDSATTTMEITPDGRIASIGAAASAAASAAADAAGGSVPFRVEQSLFWIGDSACNAAASPTHGKAAFALDAPGAPVVTATGEEEITLSLLDASADGEEWGVALELDDKAVIHLPQYQNVGRMIDSTMPVGDAYEDTVCFNFVVIEAAGHFIRLGGPLPRHRTRSFQIYRTPNGFIVTVRGPATTSLGIRIFSSLDEVQDDYCRRLERDYGVTPLKSRKEIPQWVSDIPAVLTLDMMRSDRSVSHDFGDVVALIGKLAEAGAPKHLMIYLPGWNGSYDSGGPTYGPAPELGGEEGLRAVLAAATKASFHILVHTTGWGIDPYHPDIDRMLDWVVRHDDGSIKGWQIDRKWLPPSKPFGYRPRRHDIDGLQQSGKVRLRFDEVPDWCEVGVRLGGIKGSGVRIEVAANGRTITTLPGSFDRAQVAEHPFPLRLDAGENEIVVRITEGDLDPEATPWIELHRAFRPKAPGSSWTWPILRADMYNPDYIAAFLSSVRDLVERFDIEALHVDATWMGPWESGPRLLTALRGEFPRLVIGGEGLLHATEMSIFNVVQNCKEDLIRGSGRYQATAEQGSLPIFSGRYEALEWLGRKSPVASFASRYLRTYPHLCASHSFVPVGKVCNCYPPRQVPAEQAELESILRSVVELDAAPGLRLNYREFGLDEKSREFITSLGRRRT